MATVQESEVPNLMFSHMGFTVSDLEKMEDFYTRILGFTVTDRGELAGMELVFLSRDPLDHHQLVLITGRPDNIPVNPLNAAMGPFINQMSFRVGNLKDLRALYKVLLEEGTPIEIIGSHGVSWSIYCKDPDGNMLELFVDTDWYFPQPFLLPLDLNKSDEEIYAETEEMCRKQPGFESYNSWRSKIAPKMHMYKKRYSPLST